MVLYSTVRYATTTVTVTVIVAVIVVSLFCYCYVIVCRLLILVSRFWVRVVLVPCPFAVDAIGNLSFILKNKTTSGMLM